MASSNEGIKRFVGSVKSNFQKFGNNVKTKAKNKVSLYGKCYNRAFVVGWDNADNYNSFGSAFVGGIGYRNGILSRKKYFKSQNNQTKQLNKYEKRYKNM